MRIDEKIKRELESQSEEIDKILAPEKGLFAMGFDTFKGGMRPYLAIASAGALIVSALMLWCGYRFFIGDDVGERVFWGVCFLATFQAQQTLKLWGYIEMCRNSSIREIKRVELAVERLSDRGNE